MLVSFSIKNPLTEQRERVRREVTEEEILSKKLDKMEINYNTTYGTKKIYLSRIEYLTSKGNRPYIKGYNGRYKTSYSLEHIEEVILP